MSFINFIGRTFTKKPSQYFIRADIDCWLFIRYWVVGAVDVILVTASVSSVLSGTVCTFLGTVLILWYMVHNFGLVLCWKALTYIPWWLWITSGVIELQGWSWRVLKQILLRARIVCTLYLCGIGKSVSLFFERSRRRFFIFEFSVLVMNMQLIQLSLITG